MKLQAVAAARRFLVRTLLLLRLHHHHPHPNNKSKSILRRLLLFLLLFLCCCYLLLLRLQAQGGGGGTTTTPSPLPSPPPPRKGYSVVINTWRRNELLKKSIRHYSTCSGVDSIYIVWSEPDAPTDSLYDGRILTQTVKSNSSSSSRAGVQFIMNKEDSLNNRFKPIQGLKTDAVFSVDDDVVVSCSSLEFAFSVWRSAPSTMVGFVPRMHSLHKLRSSTKQYRYRGWWYVWWTGTYSMVLSKASFFHNKYLDLYTNHMPPSIQDYVTENRNCEDIAMSFLVANVTGAPPIWVEGRIFEIGSRGISSLKGHNLQRSQCLNTFAVVYGHMPLVATTVKAIDSRKSWSW